MPRRASGIRARGNRSPSRGRAHRTAIRQRRWISKTDLQNVVVCMIIDLRTVRRYTHGSSHGGSRWLVGSSSWSWCSRAYGAFVQPRRTPTRNRDSRSRQSKRNTDGRLQVGPPILPNGDVRWVNVPIKVLVARAYEDGSPLDVIGLP